jgi:hypothetical protein
LLPSTTQSFTVPPGWQFRDAKYLPTNTCRETGHNTNDKHEMVNLGASLRECRPCLSFVSTLQKNVGVLWVQCVELSLCQSPFLVFFSFLGRVGGTGV